MVWQKCRGIKRGYLGYEESFKGTTLVKIGNMSLPWWRVAFL
ncbi:hypothetical protein EDC54_10929 [Samsonia erythrinae]|uniref:Uncharacterized protein n=1 Tax=Samsonia erythrinae TaxID=160434 RepID=A0A4V2VT39_9GAMM|nr:hypothetical protein EDC54_10929 [Samsonia erythrinae]